MNFAVRIQPAVAEGWYWGGEILGMSWKGGGAVGWGTQSKLGEGIGVFVLFLLFFFEGRVCFKYRK